MPTGPNGDAPPLSPFPSRSVTGLTLVPSLVVMMFSLLAGSRSSVALDVDGRRGRVATGRRVPAEPSVATVGVEIEVGQLAGAGQRLLGIGHRTAERLIEGGERAAGSEDAPVGQRSAEYRVGVAPRPDQIVGR